MGDLIESVNGKTVRGMKIMQLSGILRGKKGTTVRLRVNRQGKRITVTIKRAVID